MLRVDRKPQHAIGPFSNDPKCCIAMISRSRDLTMFVLMYMYYQYDDKMDKGSLYSFYVYMG